MKTELMLIDFDDLHNLKKEIDIVARLDVTKQFLKILPFFKDDADILGAIKKMLDNYYELLNTVNNASIHEFIKTNDAVIFARDTAANIEIDNLAGVH